MTDNNKIKIASKLLDISEKQAKKCYVVLPDLDAFYFSVPEKGTGSLIVANNGEVLYANSSVNYDDHITAFKNGVRTPLDAFK